MVLILIILFWGPKRPGEQLEKSRIRIVGVHGDSDEFSDSLSKLTIIAPIVEFDLSFLKVTHASARMV
ncbi:hypothetical protein CEXT_562811 [Caerostris extrusa]|uniref:Uncharacterized protein n=1 Tax=Caerostris extrusa TaxID=172846 RepID=A0AAV4VMR1_CAEEX|nr:hypothetical protein CEXT_562811 [Caerostris extrusa]